MSGTQTYGHLCAVLPPVLAQICESYIWPKSMKPYCIGKSGHYELCSHVFAMETNTVMSGACRAGNSQIVQMMIERGARAFNGGMVDACRGGHIGLVLLMMKRGADNWNGGLHGACRGGHRLIISLMIHHGANACYNCDRPISEHIVSINGI